jgi:hypothetical protein
MPIARPYCVRPLRTPGSGPVYSLRARTFSACGHSSFAAPSMRFPGSAPGSARPGVVTFSSGNHAQAMALSARMLVIPAVILMPPDAPISTLGCDAARAACRSLSGGWSWAKARHLLRECFDERGQQALQAECVARLGAEGRAAIGGGAPPGGFCCIAEGGVWHCQSPQFHGHFFAAKDLAVFAWSLVWFVGLALTNLKWLAMVPPTMN